MPTRVLIVEDDPDGRQSVCDAVADCGMQPIAAANGSDGVTSFVENDGIDVVLSDLVLPDIDGIEVMTRIRKLDAHVPVMIMTAYGSVDSSVRAMQAGAYDYITKPLDLDDLQSKLARAAETHRLRTRVNELTHGEHNPYRLDGQVAEDPASKALMDQVRSLAATNATVLIEGESGTGKEVIARGLHAESPRANGPFVVINCGAFPESLLESELFGHEKGAFTGALRQHRGAFERADGGTLFLDEIGDAPASVQVKLLRVLEDRVVTRLGAQESFTVDVRLVSATNRSLVDRVNEGEFREDLLYRLRVVNVVVPPLRARPGDIRPLTDRFVAMACREHGRHVAAIAPEVYTTLERRPWPGNVRQLRNVLESSVVMMHGQVLTVADLQMPDMASRNVDGDALRIPAHMTLHELEREALRQALERNRGNRTATADQLGIARRTIQRKIKEHGLDDGSDA
jgi:DNA-binding NtrC family response regulator